MKNREILFQGEEKQRIDVFLKKTLPNFSRAAWQKLIKNGEIKVNNKNVEKKYFLKKGDKIKIIQKDLLAKGLDLNHQFKIKLEVLFENSDFLIINKPAGLTTHPVKSWQEKTLANLILFYYPLIKNIGENSLRPGIVHRLDKEVSGLLIVAKTQEAIEYFKGEFQNHRIKKEYLALVHGQPPVDKGIINFPLIKSKSGKTVLAQKIDLEKIKEAWTEYETIRHFAPAGFTLLKVKPLSGRTHQIRVHLKSIGCPIVGDRIYSTKQFNNLAVKQLNRIFLHAHKLSFVDLNGQKREFTIDLPEELKNFLKNLN